MYIDSKMRSVTKYSFQMYFRYVHYLILMPCFLLEWLRSRLQRSLLAKRLSVQTGNRRFLGYRRCHRVTCAELLLRVVNVRATSDDTCPESGPLLQLVSYPDWKRLSPSAWMALISLSCCRKAFC